MDIAVLGGATAITVVVSEGEHQPMLDRLISQGGELTGDWIYLGHPETGPDSSADFAHYSHWPDGAERVPGSTALKLEPMRVPWPGSYQRSWITEELRKNSGWRYPGGPPEAVPFDSVARVSFVRVGATTLALLSEPTERSPDWRRMYLLPLEWE